MASSISTFFDRLSTDIGILIKNKDFDIDIKNERVLSVALRIFGTILVASAISSFVGSIAAAFSAPLAALSLIISTAALLILAHDIIVVGCNISRFHSILNPPKTDSLLGLVKDGVGRFVNASNIVYQEVARGTPHVLHGTILFEAIYNSLKTGDGV